MPAVASAKQLWSEIAKDINGREMYSFLRGQDLYGSAWQSAFRRAYASAKAACRRKRGQRYACKAATVKACSPLKPF